MVQDHAEHIFAWMESSNTAEKINILQFIAYASQLYIQKYVHDYPDFIYVTVDEEDYHEEANI